MSQILSWTGLISIDLRGDKSSERILLRPDRLSPCTEAGVSSSDWL